MAGADETQNADFIAAEVDPNQFRPTRTRALSRGLTVIAIILAICVVVSAVVIHLRESNLEAELQRRLEILSSGRAEVIETWLEGVVRPADRVVESELFRLFATEMDIAQSDLSNIAPGGQPSAADQAFEATLADQLPYMEQILSDFAQNAGFTAGYVINREGIAYVSTAGALLMSAEQQETARSLFETGRMTFGPAAARPAAWSSTSTRRSSPRSSS